MRQLTLYPPDDPLGVCEHGTSLWRVCPACRAYADAMIARFHAAVARGEYDREGYKPGERPKGGDSSDLLLP